MQMQWTKQHSKNAVAAKAKLRIARAESEPEFVRSENVFATTRSNPDFIVRIESAGGERMQTSIHRLFGRVRTSDGQSARQFCRGLEQLFTKSASVNGR
jgi:hypothetical protein